MATAIKRLLVGRALRTEQAAHERLTKKTALAVFSSDALSSTAYATEEILLVLAVAAAATSGGSFSYVVPVSVGIAVLLAVVPYLVLRGPVNRLVRSRQGKPVRSAAQERR